MRGRSSAGALLRPLGLAAVGVVAGAASAFTPALHAGPAPVGTPWKLHAIDASRRNPDGVRFADVDGDGLLDDVSAWEEGGVTRVYRNPGPAKVREPWPAVTVGTTPKAEDAVFVDLDGDGRADVVSSTEGEDPHVFVHWGPARDHLLDPDAWKQQSFPAVTHLTPWMFALPFDVDGRRGIDLVLGGKTLKGVGPSYVGWLESPESPRDVAAWRWHPFTHEVRWVMSLLAEDVNGDGRKDIVYTDKMGPQVGVHWLEHPAARAEGAEWPRHDLAVAELQGVGFAAIADLDGDGRRDVLVTATRVRGEGAAAERRHAILFLRKLDDAGRSWETHEIAAPAHTGAPKGVSVGDVDLDGRRDLVISCSGAEGDLVGVYWLSYRKSVFDPIWDAHDISGPLGVKYDLVPLIDLDGDGDLDAISTEEHEYEKKGLGVIWYENPARARR